MIELSRGLSGPNNNRIPDRQLGSLLAAVGNNEAKAHVFSRLRLDHPLTRKDLDVIFAESQGARLGWKLSEGSPFGYCRQSFEPIGIVAREVVDAEGEIYGYSKTPYGERVGVPLAGLLLDFSLRHPNVSLEDFFGRTSSNATGEAIEVEGENVEYKKRSPLLRFKLLWELATMKLPARVADLTHNLKETPTQIRGALTQLSDRDLVDFDPAAPTPERVIYYKLSPEHPLEAPEMWGTQRRLTNAVYSAVEKDPDRWWSVNDVGTEIVAKKTVFAGISSILSYLHANGFLLKDGYTTIDLTRVQRSTILDLVTTLDRFQQGDPETLSRGRELIYSLRAEDISLLMAKAKAHSSSANRVDAETVKTCTLSLIASNKEITNTELRRLLINELGKVVTRGSVWSYVNLLRSEGKIKEFKQNGISYWQVTN